MEKVIIHGIVLVKFMMANGLGDKDMDMVYGKLKRETAILGNGGMAKLWVMEYLLGTMETNTKENGI